LSSLLTHYVEPDEVWKNYKSFLFWLKKIVRSAAPFFRLASRLCSQSLVKHMAYKMCT
jgi:hypothetical protein